VTCSVILLWVPCGTANAQALGGGVEVLSVCVCLRVGVAVVGRQLLTGQLHSAGTFDAGVFLSPGFPTFNVGRFLSLTSAIPACLSAAATLHLVWDARCLRVQLTPGVVAASGPDMRSPTPPCPSTPPSGPPKQLRLICSLTQPTLRLSCCLNANDCLS
jgi:hypothetical protein